MRGRKRKTEEQASSSSAREIRPESPLAVALLRMWCLGDLSAKIVQELSQAAVKSGCTQADLVGLASLGGHGVNPNHTHQQLVSRVFKNMAAPEPTVVETKAWGKNATGQKIQIDCKLPVLLPHSWMLSLDDMDEEILGIQDIARFWDAKQALTPGCRKARTTLTRLSRTPKPWSLSLCTATQLPTPRWTVCL